VEGWSQKYDLVIFDTSPLLPVSDGRVLAGVCDSALLVVRADHADRRELAETLDILEATPVQTLGVVLNGVKIRNAGSKKTRGYYSYRDAYRGRTDPAAQLEESEEPVERVAVQGEVMQSPAGKPTTGGEN
jgi:Mrp family chromosome partitioning ATPase